MRLVKADIIKIYCCYTCFKCIETTISKKITVMFKITQNITQKCTKIMSACNHYIIYGIIYILTNSSNHQIDHENTCCPNFNKI